jgi:PAS domain S-box-containing protein
MLRLLLVDDNPNDRLLIVRELSREFPDAEVEEIIKPEDLTLALSAGQFDLVITDYQLRWDDGLTVLREIKSRYPDCPVIMFTDSGSQEVAVEAMKAGLDDYLIKSPKHYARLPIVVRSTLQRAESQQRVARLELRLQTLLNDLNVGVFRSTLDGRLLEGNVAFLRLVGVSSLQEARTLDLHQLFLSSPAELQSLNQERKVHLHRADGSAIWVSLSQSINTTEPEPVIEGLIEDITERKIAQEALQHAKDELEIRVAERTQRLQQINERLLAEMREHEQAQQSLRESEERYRQLVDLSPDAIFINNSGQFVFVNRAAVELFGATSPSELIGKPIIDRVHPDHREIVKARMRKNLDQKQPTGLMEQKLLRLDGIAIDVEVAAAPFTYQQQAAVQVVVRDIRDRKKAEENLRQALAKERKLSELKSRIISTISHEYRTPLTTILSSAELLEHYSEKLTQQRKLLHLQRIQASTKHLSDLVNDVLFIGQVEANSLKFNPELLDLEQFCQELIETMRDTAQNGTTIRFNCRGDCTNTYLDEKLLRQILTNLLTNAIKYSPHGSTVRFEIECKKDIAVLRIQDEGIGIPTEDLPELFESFHRASNVGTIPGTGLGLAIVKKSVDLHGGQLAVDSVVGVGTTFTLTLPCTCLSSTR